MDNGFFAWVQLAWDWFVTWIGWTGILAFVIGTVFTGVGFAHLFKWLHDRKTRRQFGEYAPLVDYFRYDPARESLACTWRMARKDEPEYALDAVQEQANLVAASCWREDSGEHEVSR